MEKHVMCSKRLRKGIQHNWRLYILMLPALLWLVVFAYYPMYGLLIAFKDFKAVAGIYRARTLVDEAMEECDGDVLVLPEFAPWKGEAAGSSYKFVVYPSSRGGFSAQGVPVSIDDKTLVCPFPDEWCGKTPDELVQITGIQTLRFCHPNAFLIAADEKEDAIKAARLALEMAQAKKM